jgi:hypothetical protein
MEGVILNILKKLEYNIDLNPVVQQVINDSQGLVIKRERDLFVYKLTMINAWTAAILEEIELHSSFVYQNLDDWVVIAIQQEEQINQQVNAYLREVIDSEIPLVDEYKTQVQSLQLFSSIKVTHFSG